MTYETDRRLFHAMKEAGWAHDLETEGFRKDDLWVSWGQAEALLAAIDNGESVPFVPQSETLAKIITSAANDGFIDAVRPEPADERKPVELSPKQLRALQKRHQQFQKYRAPLDAHLDQIYDAVRGDDPGDETHG